MHRVLSSAVRFLSCLVLIAALAVVHQGHAQRSGGPDAKALFDEGLKDMLAGNFGIGCPLIKRSLDLDRRAGTLFTLAECYRRAGKYASAVELYDEFLAVYAALPEDERKAQQARGEISKQERGNLLNRVPWLIVALPLDAPDGVVILLDDEPFSHDLLEVAFAIDPGPHEFRTRAPGGRWTGTRVQLQEGQRLRVTLNISDPNGSDQLSDPGMPSNGSAEASTRRVSPWFWITGGIGLASLATGAVTGAILLEKAQTIRDGCNVARPDGRTGCQPEAFKAVERSRTLAPVTTAALSVAAGGMVAATVIWLISDRNQPRKSTGIRPSIRVNARSGEASIEGHF